MSETITGHMATILAEMHARRAPRTRDDILSALDGAVTYTVFIRAVRELVSRGLVEVVRERVPNKKIPALITISDAGVVALRLHRRRQKEALRQADKSRVAPPRRINLFTLPVLTLQAGGYQRNDGNKHIGSRGVGC